ncbi:COG4223 family protein [Neorhizobium sp. NCHU2750]|uniref:COG4223 family protein n=1 Tax=Neorhizobium sp. NCHU2750 TaxID=1825976 RepID=UPI000E73239A|nr:hypothetical protein NCHU2750_34380 [Neorhizobium sp. NCHU2750]
MVSEKPPRRSKTNKEPVTIDLTAEETAAVAEPVRANDTDEPVVPVAEDEAAESPVAAEHPVTDAATSPATSAPAALTDAEPVKSTADAAKLETPPFDDPAPEFRSDPDASTGPANTAETATKPEATKTSVPPYEPRPAQDPAKKPLQRPAPATSTLVAAGIFGGIVALLLAGSMQYAGVLPSAASSASNEANLTADIASLRQQVAALASRPAEPSADLVNRIAALENGSSGGGSDEAVAQRIAALESELSSIKSVTETNAGRLQQAEAQIADKGPEQMAARAVAAAALKSAIDRGGSFSPELETYKTLAADDPSIAELQPLAAKGVMSRVELQAQASSVANAMIDAVSQPDPNLGIADRLMASALSVIKVRKVGDVTGNTPEDIIARFEDRLRSGDLQAAASEWAALPKPAKAASQGFKQELDARIKVESLVSGTLTRAITGTQG